MRGAVLPCFRAFYEGMKPALRCKRFRCQAAELPEFRDHMRLVSVTHVERGPSPVDVLATARVSQPGLKSGKPAIEFGWNANAFAEHASQVLPRNPRGVSKVLDSQPAAAPKHPRRQTRCIERNCLALLFSNSPKQSRFQAVDPGCRVCLAQRLWYFRAGRTPQIFQSYDLIGKLRSWNLCEGELLPRLEKDADHLWAIASGARADPAHGTDHFCGE
jgi:hypothetical protein